MPGGARPPVGGPIRIEGGGGGGGAQAREHPALERVQRRRVAGGGGGGHQTNYRIPRDPQEYAKRFIPKDKSK